MSCPYCPQDTGEGGWVEAGVREVEEEEEGEGVGEEDAEGEEEGEFPSLFN